MPDPQFEPGVVAVMVGTVVTVAVIAAREAVVQPLAVASTK